MPVHHEERPSSDRRAGGPTTTPSVEELLRQWSATGDIEVFAAFYDQLSPYVYGVVHRVLRDPDQAEEVTRRVFGDIAQNAAFFTPDSGTAVNWTLLKAQHAALDWLRAQSPRRVT